MRENKYGPGTATALFAAIMILAGTAAGATGAAADTSAAVVITTAPGDTPPKVVKIVPDNGSTNVDPNLEEILIHFDQPMTDQSWSVTGGGENYPDIKAIRYTKGCTVLEIKVKLKPGWRYQFGLNSPSFQNFKSAKGVPLRPVLVTFSTRGKKGTAGSKSTASSAGRLKSLGKMPFDLVDVNGMSVSHRDYKGVPIFMAFGPAW
jgi:hypothetical protein